MAEKKQAAPALPMSPARLAQVLEVLRWSNRGLGDAVGRPEKHVRRWLDPNDKMQVPDKVAEWLEVLARHAEQHPPPVLPPIPLRGPRHRGTSPAEVQGEDGDEVVLDGKAA